MTMRQKLTARKGQQHTMTSNKPFSPTILYIGRDSPLDISPSQLYARTEPVPRCVAESLGESKGLEPLEDECRGRQYELFNSVNTIHDSVRSTGASLVRRVAC